VTICIVPRLLIPTSISVSENNGGLGSRGEIFHDTHMADSGLPVPGIASQESNTCRLDGSREIMSVKNTLDTSSMGVGHEPRSSISNGEGSSSLAQTQKPAPTKSIPPFTRELRSAKKTDKLPPSEGDRLRELAKQRSKRLRDRKKLARKDGAGNANQSISDGTKDLQEPPPPGGNGSVGEKQKNRSRGDGAKIKEWLHIPGLNTAALSLPAQIFVIHLTRNLGSDPDFIDMLKEMRKYFDGHAIESIKYELEKMDIVEAISSIHNSKKVQSVALLHRYLSHIVLAIHVFR
jgi:hypothetical protein